MNALTLICLMKSICPAILLSCLLLACCNADENALSVDSKPQDAVPQGRIDGPFDFSSSVFPGTTRKYWIYVPVQYDASVPACSFILQDGLGRAKGWKVPTVLDNLIHKKEVPVQIGIFVDHGKVEAAKAKGRTRFNRSFEYDSMGDRYARFLIEELLPEVSKKYNLSDDPNDRAIGGASSGAICAFTAAWERPDSFRRVLSTIGTYVGLRGGNEYPTLIRKSEPKPIRVFLQDGSSDLDIYGGGWWTANQSMLSALQFADYDVHHIWGTGGHNGKHAAAIMPEAIRWLWRDYPAPIKPRYGAQRRTKVLVADQTWVPLDQPCASVGGIATDRRGRIYLADTKGNAIVRISANGTSEVFAHDIPGPGKMDFDGQGHLYVCAQNQLLQIDESGAITHRHRDIACEDVVAVDGGVICANAGQGVLSLITTNGQKQILQTDAGAPCGLTLTPDHAFLIVADAKNRFQTSYQLAGNALFHGQPYGYAHLDSHQQASQSGGMTVDSEGRVYLGTPLGVQIFDQLGRVHLILQNPTQHPVDDVTFAGKDRNRLVMVANNAVYQREVLTRGVQTGTTVTPPKPGL